MFRVALTGGIGSGKSTIAHRFSGHGITVIDADAIAHRITLPGEPATAEIFAAFGQPVDDGTGGIDRKKLATLVFHDAARRKRLEGILHPLIRAEILKAARAAESPYCLLVIPLLVESSMQDLADRVLVVDVSPETQIARTRERDGRGEEEIRAILRAQATREQRLAVADDVIVNDGDIERLNGQVDRLHGIYLQMARAATA